MALNVQIAHFNIGYYAWLLSFVCLIAFYALEPNAVPERIAKTS